MQFGSYKDWIYITFKMYNKVENAMRILDQMLEKSEAQGVWVLGKPQVLEQPSTVAALAPLFL